MIRAPSAAPRTLFAYIPCEVGMRSLTGLTALQETKINTSIAQDKRLISFVWKLALRMRRRGYVIEITHETYGARHVYSLGDLVIVLESQGTHDIGRHVNTFIYGSPLNRARAYHLYAWKLSLMNPYYYDPWDIDEIPNFDIEFNGDYQTMIDDLMVTNLKLGS